MIGWLSGYYDGKGAGYSYIIDIPIDGCSKVEKNNIDNTVEGIIYIKSYTIYLHYILFLQYIYIY